MCKVGIETYFFFLNLKCSEKRVLSDIVNVKGSERRVLRDNIT